MTVRNEITNITESDKPKDIISAYKNALTNYFNFSGRTSRYDYWAFILMNTIVELAIGGLVVVSVQLMNFVSFLYSLFIIIPMMTISFRRLHDINKSGWLLTGPSLALLGIVIIFTYNMYMEIYNVSVEQFLLSNKFSIGLLIVFGILGYFIYLLYLFCLNGDKSENRFGKPIKEDDIYRKKFSNLILSTLGISLLGNIFIDILMLIAGKDYAETSFFNMFDTLQQLPM